MTLIKTNRTNLTLLLLRIGFGGLMLVHGIPKLTSFPNANFPDPFGFGSSVSMGLAIFAETICALLVCLGLWTRLSVIPLLITMFTAVVIIHSSDPFQKKELGILYFIVFLVLFIAGPGDYSVDRKLSKNL